MLNKQEKQSKKEKILIKKKGILDNAILRKIAKGILFYIVFQNLF